MYDKKKQTPSFLFLACRSGRSLIVIYHPRGNCRRGQRRSWSDNKLQLDPIGGGHIVMFYIARHLYTFTFRYILSACVYVCVCECVFMNVCAPEGWVKTGKRGGGKIHLQHLFSWHDFFLLAETDGERLVDEWFETKRTEGSMGLQLGAVALREEVLGQ